MCVVVGRVEGESGVLNARLSPAQRVSQLIGPVLFGAVSPAGTGRGKNRGVEKERSRERARDRERRVEV